MAPPESASTTVSSDIYPRYTVPIRRTAPNKFLGETVLAALRQYAKEDPFPAQIDGHDGSEKSFSEVLLEAVQCAEGFRALGYKPGDIIAIYSKNYHDVFTAFLGALFSGITVAALVPISTADELRHSLSLCEPRAIISESSNIKNALEAAAPDMLHFMVGDGPRPDGVETIADLRARGSSADPDTFKLTPIEDRLKHISIILFSSGTTGLPKGVMLSDNSFATQICNMEAWCSEYGETYLQSSPLCWITGPVKSIENYIVGVTRVFVRQATPDFTVEIMEKFKINRWIGPSPLLFLIKSVVDKGNYDLSHLKLILCGGAALSAQVQQAVIDSLGVPVMQAYGSTETNCVFIDKFPVKPGAMGLVSPGTYVRVVDPATGKDIRDDSPGELRVKTHFLMSGYIGNKKETDDSFDEHGYYITGDIAYGDKDGYFYFVDRIKEMLKYKSMQMAPAEVEAVLNRHPAVMENCVVGRSHPTDGDLPTAFVVRKKGVEVTENELQEFVKDKLAFNKWLYGGVIFVDSIPKLVSGKTARQKLKEMLKTIPAPPHVAS